MVHVIGGIERRRAREEEIVVDLQCVDPFGLTELSKLSPVDDTTAETGDGGVGIDRRDREDADTLCLRRTRLCVRVKPLLPHETNVPVVTQTTVFEVVGGQPFFDALVARFYVRVVADPALRSLYPLDLAPGIRALALFLGQYWGGPTTYSDEKGHPRLRMRHAPFAIAEPEREAWLTAMLAALGEADAPEAAKAMMRQYFTTASTAMINTVG